MKKHLLWITELVVWILIIFTTIFVSLYIYNKNIREKNTYNVFFHDVDGLIKGSPVKIQGYQIGYVSNISIVNDEAFVTFVVTDNKITMPSNFTASVAFTGMGGSKSLELFVPKAGAVTKNYITTKEPRRINDFYVYQNQIAQNIVTMTSDFMRMFNDKVTGKMINFIRNPYVFGEIHGVLDSIQDSESQFMNKMEKK